MKSGGLSVAIPLATLQEESSGIEALPARLRTASADS